MADNYSNRLSDLTRRFSGESRPLNALAELDSPATTNLNMLAQALRGRSQPRKQLDLQSAMDSAAMGLGPVPVIGDVLGLAADANRFVNEPESRTPLNFGLAALGLIPFIPPLVSMGLGKFAQSQGKQLAQLPTGPARNQAGAIVYHGSPHKFDQFDSSKIGTGEGAQAYGHGLYFAENPEVAKGYKASTTKPEYMVDGRLYKADDGGVIRDEAGRTTGNLPMAIQDATRALYGSKPGQSLQTLAEEAESFLQTRAGMSAKRIAEAKQAILDGKVEYLNRGSLYKVDLPDEAIAKMLDWDKPLSQQAPEVKKQLKIIGIDPEKHGGTGATLISELKGLPGIADMPWMGRGEDYLTQNNIPGIRYLDGGSRGAGEGTRNFVVFPGNENMLRILSRE